MPDHVSPEEKARRFQIAHLMTDRNLAHVAADLDVSERTIQRWVVSGVTWDVADVIAAKVCNMPTEYLFGPDWAAEADAAAECPPSLFDALDGMEAVNDPTVLLIGCTKSKHQTAAKARDLYATSDLFRRRRGYAEQAGYPWAILSALHGLVPPDKVLDPYDWTMDDTVRKMDVWAWASGSLRDAARMVGVELGRDERLTIEVHAGVDYVRPLRAAAERYTHTFIDIITPLEGLGIGSQKHWYTNPTLFTP